MQLCTIFQVSNLPYIFTEDYHPLTNLSNIILFVPRYLCSEQVFLIITVSLMLLTSTSIFLEKPSNVGLRRVDLCSLTSASRVVSSFYYLNACHIGQKGATLVCCQDSLSLLQTIECPWKGFSLHVCILYCASIYITQYPDLEAVNCCQLLLMWLICTVPISICMFLFTIKLRFFL